MISSWFMDKIGWVTLGLGIPSMIIFSIVWSLQLAHTNPPPATFPINVLSIGTIVFFGVTIVGIGFLMYAHKDDYKSCPKCGLPRRLHGPWQLYALRFYGCTLTEDEI